MTVQTLQPAFTTGEISPALYARVDVARYQSALRTCRNFIVRPYGGVQNRPGTQFVGEIADSSKTVRLIPFEVSDSDNYVVEAGDGYMRFVFDGGYLAVSGAAAYNAGTTYVINDFVSYSGSNYRALRTTIGDQPDISPLDWVQDDIYRITSPYTEADLTMLKFTQSADVMTICHPDYRQRELRRLTATTWEIREFENENGPFGDQNTDYQIQVHAARPTGRVSVTSSVALFTADDVGKLIRLQSEGFDEEDVWEPAKAVALGDLVRVEERVYQATGAGTTGTVRPTHTSGARYDGDPGVQWVYLHSSFGVIEITQFNSSTSVTGDVVTQIPNGAYGGLGASVMNWPLVGDGVTRTFSIAGATADKAHRYLVIVDADIMRPYEEYTVDNAADTITFATAPANGAVINVDQRAAINRTSRWTLSSWGEDVGYPRAVAYFGDRLAFGGSRDEPQSVWLSRVGSYPDFGTSNPILADDAISESLNSRKLNEVRDIVPLSKLIILTSSGEWLTRGGQDDVITPESVSFTQQSYFGTHTLQARIIGNSAIYVQNGGRVVRDLGYVFESDAYTGSDLTLLAGHLTRYNELVDMDFQSLPYSTMWFVRDDGVMLSMTYVKDQDVIGWARHDTDGTFENVAVIPEGSEESAYFVVKRTINGQTKRYIERLAVRDREDIRDAFFVDSGLTYDGRNTGATTMTLTGGVAWTEGETFTLTASSNTFVLGDVSDYVFLYGEDDTLLQLLITGFTSALIVSVTSVGNVGAEFQATATTEWGLARNVFSGLDHLEGKEVAILADGNVVSNGDGDPSYEVTAGAVTIPNHAAVVHIGLPYVSDMETLDITQLGGEIVRARPKAVPRVDLIVEASRSVLIGPDATNLYEHKPRTFEDYDAPNDMVTGLMTVNTSTKFAYGGRIFVRQNQPLPLSVLGVVPDLEVGGR